MIETLIGIISGLLIGIILGLIPGMHINLLMAWLISLSISINSQTLLSFIISSSISYTIISIIPSILLGAPTEETITTTLPGHELFNQGKAHQAIITTLHGSLISILFFPIIILFLTYIILPNLEKISKFIPGIICFIMLFIWFRDLDLIKSGIIILLSGLLGILTLLLPIQDALTPLLGGLFGLSGLLTSFQTKTKIKQSLTSIKNSIPKKQELVELTKSIIPLLPLAGTLPGISTGQVSTLSAEIKQSPNNFLLLNGFFNVLIMITSFFIFLYSGRTRSGSALALRELNYEISFISILIICLISGLLSYFLAIYISKKSILYLEKINYNKLIIIISIFYLLLTLFLSGTLGLLILFTSTSLGIYCIKSNTKRIHLTASLIIPTIIAYLFL